MYRYVALIWDAAREQRCEAARTMAARLRTPFTEWVQIFSAPGMLVLHGGERPRASCAHAIANHGGVVLGRLFDRHSRSSGVPCATTDGLAGSQRILASAGRNLIDAYWGRYVAFLFEAETGTAHVVRDPTGAFPCFFTSYRGVDIYFSRVEDCVDIGALRGSVNWSYIAGHVAFRFVQTYATALEGVEEVQPGEIVSTRGGLRQRSLHWCPFRIAETDPVEDPREAVKAVRETTIQCVGAWAAGYDGILHLLSGGLDSSIVLSCLRQAPTAPGLTALNYFTPTSDGDERAFARLAARKLQCPLVETAKDALRVGLDRMLDIRRSAKPWSYLHYLEHGAYEAQLASEHGATAVFTGSGGDGLFYRARARYGVADFIHRHGMRPQVLGIALNAALLERVSLWSVLGNTVRDLRSGSHTWAEQAGASAQLTLVNADVLRSLDLEDFMHPWLRAVPGRLPPGKQWHVLSMSIPQAFYDPFGNEGVPERIAPLVMSQPLIELFLRIPSYVLSCGGWDRAIARRAFTNDLPREIIGRRAKGGINQHIRQVFESNIGFIREVMLDGELVNRGLLDRTKLEACLAGRRGVTAAEFSEIQDHLSTEVWIRTWQRDEQRAVA